MATNPERLTQLPLVERAVTYATAAHKGQDRKASTIPYIVHPYSVAMTVARAGYDEELIAAALLHDVLEDTASTADELEALCGARVTAIVIGCSEPDKAAPWEERKRHTISHLRSAPAEVLTVSLADKLHNLRTIVADRASLGAAVWERFKRGKSQQAWYYRSLAAVFQERFKEGAVPAPTYHPAFCALVRDLFDDDSDEEGAAAKD